MLVNKSLIKQEKSLIKQWNLIKTNERFFLLKKKLFYLWKSSRLSIYFLFFGIFCYLKCKFSENTRKIGKIGKNRNFL